MPAAPSRAAPDPPDLVAERGMPALADEQPWKQHRRLSHPRFSCDRRAGANSTMPTRPLYLLLLLHRPQGAAAFSARDAPVDEGGSGRAAAQHVGPEAAVGRKLSHLNPAGHYEHFSTGASCEANGCATVSTAAECQAAAQALASATVYGSYDSSYAPLGCYAYVSGPSSWYYFNTADSATGTCSSSPLCVCACGTFPPTSPPSPPALPPMLPSPPTLPPPPLPPMTPTRVGDAKYGCGHAGAHVRSVSPASDGQPETLSNGDLVTAVLDSSVTCIKLANGTYYLSSTLTIGHTVALVAENGRAVLDGGGGGFVVVDVASSGDAALSNLVVQNGGGGGGYVWPAGIEPDAAPVWKWPHWQHSPDPLRAGWWRVHNWPRSAALVCDPQQSGIVPSKSARPCFASDQTSTVHRPLVFI